MNVGQGREMCSANVFFSRSIETTSNIACGEGLPTLQQVSVVFHFSSCTKAVVIIHCDVSYNYRHTTQT